MLGAEFSAYSVFNGIKQGISSPLKLFDIYVYVRSQKLDKNVGCPFSGIVIFHLHYADDLALTAP